MLDAEKIYADPIVTEVRAAETFWPAEGYHQDFYNQHQTKPYCQIVINPKLAKLREKFKQFLKEE